MIYTENTKKAMKLCFEAHKDQVDKSGLPYVFHPFHLAEQMTDETTTVVALLHDVVEDSPYTIEDLQRLGFEETILQALALLTHADGVPYMAYVAEIAKNPIAKAVKLADLRHNSDLSRLNVVDEKALKRFDKYKAAIALLEANVLTEPENKEHGKGMRSQKEIVELFKDYLDTTEYFELLYSNLHKSYVSITKPEEIQSFKTVEELASHILYQFLLDIAFSEEFEEDSNGDRITAPVIDAFWERIAPYIEKMPELEELAEDLVATVSG